MSSQSIIHRLLDASRSSRGSGTSFVTHTKAGGCVARACPSLLALLLHLHKQAWYPCVSGAESRQLVAATVPTLTLVLRAMRPG